MHIFITGANGFIGANIAKTMSAAGHDVTLCVRDPKTVQRNRSAQKLIDGDFSRDHEVSGWLPRLAGIDVVINCVGIICESGSQTFDALHTRAPIALFSACEAAGVKRVIQLSALGADETAFSQYHLSKKAADDHLMTLDLEWAIVMPSIVYGPGAKSMAMFKAIAGLPVVPLIDAGDQSIQPIHVDDLTRGVSQLVEMPSQLQVRIEMVGPEPVTMAELYTRVRVWLGFGRPRFISIPYGLTILGARLGGFLGNTPMNAEAVQMLRNGNTGDVTGFIDCFGFKPRSLSQALAAVPAQEADRWHAGLYLLRPMLRIAIGLVWLFTGIVSAFLFPTEQSYAMLAMAGITGLWAPLMLYGAAATDMLLGLATLSAYRLPWIGALQILVIVLYTTTITFTQPEQWIHPFGPVSKNLPLIVATLIMIVLERKR